MIKIFGSRKKAIGTIGNVALAGFCLLCSGTTAAQSNQREGAKFHHFDLGWEWAKRHGVAYRGHVGGIYLGSEGKIELELTLQRNCEGVNVICPPMVIMKSFDVVRSRQDHCGTRESFAKANENPENESLVVTDHRKFACSDPSGYNFPRRGTRVAYVINTGNKSDYLRFEGSDIGILPEGLSW